MTDTQLVTTDPPTGEVLPAIATTGQSMVTLLAQLARDPTVDVAKLESLMRLHREFERDFAAERSRIAFYRALSEAQSEMAPVVRDADNDQTRSKYARLETIDEAIRPIYTRHGFSLTFNQVPAEETGKIKIACDVSHGGGHAHTYSLEARPDVLGPKGTVNKTDMHGLGSAVSYLRRYLTCMIFNVVLKYEDDDGNAGGGRVNPNNRRPPPERPRESSNSREPSNNRAVDVPWLRKVLESLDNAGGNERWLKLVLAAFERAPTATDLAGLYNCPGVKEARAKAPREVVRDIDTAHRAASRRLALPAESPTLPPFEAQLVDAFGFPLGDPFTNRRIFAAALVEQWQAVKSQAEVDTLLEYNEASIDDARADADAARVLAPLDEPRDFGGQTKGQTEPPRTFDPVRPATDRDRVAWAPWVRTIKAALDAVIDADLDAWTLAQQGVLGEAPLAQRVPIVRALMERYAAHPHESPLWLRDLLRTTATPPAEGSADERAMAKLLDDLAAADTRAAIDALAATLRPTMIRWRKETPAFFERADRAFGRAIDRLNGGRA